MLAPQSLGVTHPVLPCGAKVILRTGDTQVLSEVIDNALVEPGRQLEVTEALATTARDRRHRRARVAIRHDQQQRLARTMRPRPERPRFRDLPDTEAGLAGFDLGGNRMLHPADESPAVANLASQVGAVRSVGNAYLRLRLTFTCLLVHVYGRGHATGSSSEHPNCG